MADIEQENTFRALKDEPLLMKSNLCRFGWHQWQQWSKPYIPKGSSINIQHRYCDSCGTVKIKQLKV